MTEKNEAAERLHAMLDRSAFDYGYGANRVEAKRLLDAALAAERQRVVDEAALDALRKLNRDWHDRSKRPCPTCDPISQIIGEPFGCAAFRIAEAERAARRADR